MAGQSNAAPVIIKRKKVIVGGGHHGGAWKVAYADFVTAMMAFFLLMWLLNATTEQQRKGLADYFNPSIPISRTSGGGNGAFGGDSILSENTLLGNGSGTSSPNRSRQNQASNTDNAGADSGAAPEVLLAEVEKQLLARSGESATMERILQHVVTRITDEGLVIELFDLPDAALFKGEAAEPNEILGGLASVLADVLVATTNALAINGHTHSYPIVLIDNPVWGLSAARGQKLREMMVQNGLPDSRFARVSGHADRDLVVADASNPRNNRLEVILLRPDR
ncbi:flagellar motor protein MotB [Pseudotabrizicola sp. L79]|uniref:flagellar motor protein MotB n=1 Tax=Pseudotabrizicola sp. L79 TaxID=3118402 RepID=UPI002F953C96